MPIHPVEQRYTHRGVFATPGAKINPSGSPPEGSANRIPQIRSKKAASNVKGLKLNAHPFIKRMFCRERHREDDKEKTTGGTHGPRGWKVLGNVHRGKTSPKEKAWRKKRRLRKIAAGIKGHKKSQAAARCGGFSPVGGEGVGPPPPPLSGGRPATAGVR